MNRRVNSLKSQEFLGYGLKFVEGDIVFVLWLLQLKLHRLIFMLGVT